MSQTNQAVKLLKNGIFDENPVFVQVIALCPVLAITTQAVNGLGMGLVSTAIMMTAFVAISLLRKLIPSTVRIPCYIIIIAGIVTAAEFLLAGFAPDLNDALGIFIPLIATNCVLFARVESFASKNGPFLALVDGVGIGLGFTIALVALGIVRELLGLGSVFGVTVLPEFFPRTTAMILAPGAFIALGIMIAVINYIRRYMTGKKVSKA